MTRERGSAVQRVRTVVGDLHMQVPVGLVVARCGVFEPREHQVMHALASDMAPLALLCLEFDDPQDLDTLRPDLQRLMTQVTPTIVLSTGPKDMAASCLAFEFNMLDLEPSEPGWGSRSRGVDIMNSRSPIGLKQFERPAALARETWAESVQLQDEAYWCRLKSWAGQQGVATDDTAVDRVMGELRHWMDSPELHPTTPRSLFLNVDGLLCLPPLPPRNLRHLALEGCRFHDIRPLPASLVVLSLVGNGLTDIHIEPASLPLLRSVDLSHNQFTTLPPLLRELCAAVTVHLTHNPLDNPTRIELRQTRHERARPWFVIDPFRPGTPSPSADFPGEEATHSSAESVSDGDSDEDFQVLPLPPRLPRSRPRWGEPNPGFDQPATPPQGSTQAGPLVSALVRLVGRFGDERNAKLESTLGRASFVQWIERLGRLPSKQRDRIVPGLVELVDQCQQDADLCQLVLAVVEDASTSCDDRVTLTWERVRLLVRCQTILQGGLDGRLQEVVALARQALRHEAIARMSHAHTTTARQRQAVTLSVASFDRDKVEEIEVHLAYLTQTAGALAVETEAGFGRFIDTAISGVSFRDVSRAVREVRAHENTHFLSFLTQWAPWIGVLRRLAPESMEAIDEAAADLAPLERWRQEATRLAMDSGLHGPMLQDAVTKAIAQRGRDQRTESLQALTLALLADRQQQQLLDPAWPGQ